MKYLLNGHESERLQFRLLEESDFDWWLEFASNPVAIQYFGFLGEVSPKEFCQLWFGKVFERYKMDTGGHNVLVNKTTGERIGMAGLLIQDVDGEKELEVAYSIHPKFWRKGYASEAANECRKYAFKNSWADSLISIIHKENIGSIKTAKSNKMTFEKETIYKEIPVFIFRINKEN